MCVYCFKFNVWCVCDVLYVIYSRHIEGLLRSHWSYGTWLLSCCVSKLFYFVLLVWKTLFTSVIDALTIWFISIQKMSTVFLLELLLLYDHSVKHSINLVIDERVNSIQILFWNKFELLCCFVG